MSDRTFSATLNEYCSMLGLSNREIASACGVSASTLSRYRSGGRVPGSGSTAIQDLAEGISRLAHERGLDEGFQSSQVFAALSASAKRKESHSALFHERLDELMGTFSISNAELARFAHVDPSFISRIRNGSRYPSEPEWYARSFSQLVARRAVEQHMVEKLRLMLGETVWRQDGPDGALDTDAIARSVELWLLADMPSRSMGVDRFLTSLDGFDLNEYIKAIRYDELQVPTVPLVIPTSKTYYGVQQMREAELEFLKVTATARNARAVTMFSDMPMTELAADAEFAKRYALGVGALLKRGVHLTVIHDVTRPFEEMMLGLEGWIPLYMTGQVSPYYLKGERDRVFGHLCNVSDVSALTAECVRGHHDEGRYRLTTRREDVAYYRRRMARVVERATPLMEIYRESDQARYARYRREEAERRRGETPKTVGDEVFRNMTIYCYSSDLVVIEKEHAPRISFVIRHPLLCDAIANMEPVLIDDCVDAG